MCNPRNPTQNRGILPKTLHTRLENRYQFHKSDVIYNALSKIIRFQHTGTPI